MRDFDGERQALGRINGNCVCLREVYVGFVWVLPGKLDLSLVKGGKMAFL